MVLFENHRGHCSSLSTFYFFLAAHLNLGGREGDGWLAMRNNGELAAVNFSYVSFTGIYNLKIVVFWNAPICLGFNQFLNHGKPSRSHWRTDTTSGATRFPRQGTKSGIQCILHSTLPNSRAPLSGLGAGKENVFLNETNIIRSDRC